VTGLRVAADALPLHLRRARVTRTGIEANTSICSGMLQFRYSDVKSGAKSGVKEEVR